MHIFWKFGRMTALDDGFFLVFFFDGEIDDEDEEKRAQGMVGKTAGWQLRSQRSPLLQPPGNFKGSS